ncbi:hypothetical protein TNCV_2317111 [Trichonephila clavipes]|nr:hypothetical protein TNCV_2317111 [Trichonephila clavipes]
MNVMTVHLYPLEYVAFLVYRKLDEKRDKSDLTSTHIRAISYETVEIRYLSNLWNHVYIDRSKIEHGTGAGSRTCCNHFVSNKAVGRDTTNFDGEAKAICFLLNEFSARKSYFL